VKGIADDIQIKLFDSDVRNDGDIASAALKLIERSALIPACCMQ